MSIPTSDVSGSLAKVLGDHEKVAVILSAGPDRPSSEKRLLIVGKRGSTVLSFDRLLAARWTAAGDLVIQSHAGVEKVAQSGKVLASLAKPDSGQTAPFPSPVGDLLLVHKLNPKTGLTGIELVRMGSPPATVSAVDYKTTPNKSWGTSVAWSPDATKVAVTMLTKSEGARGLTPSIGFLDLTRPSSPAVVDKQLGARITPLVWSMAGIYAKRDSDGQTDLVLCDPNGAECELVYDAGKNKAVTTAALINSDQLIVVVRDLVPDPYELRGSELYRLRPSSRTADLLLRLPPDVYVNGMDSTDAK